MAKTRVGVIRGGVSPEYDVSLKTGGSVLKQLPYNYHGIDILITKDGTWHIDGIPVTPEQVSRRIDVIFNALHGEYGGDGKIQRILDDFKIPYTGSKTYSSSIALNKYLSKKYFNKYGLKTPLGRIIRIDEDIDEIAFSIFNSIPAPWIVKPTSSGSSLGVSLVKEYEDLVRAIMNASKHSESAIVEEFIPGIEAAVCIIDGSMGNIPHTLPVIEIIRAHGESILEYQDKFAGNYKKYCPARFGDSEIDWLEKNAQRAHLALGLRHYSTVNCIVSPKGTYFLEINSQPDLSEHSLFAQALECLGAPFEGFLDHVITLALEDK